ncbi:protein OSCP1-like [Palaemon carinicauda]|uniref:protein OSCP1-like n=1 Tax=Palaemon carinicauda TaxID=392227 RepID=UPI0035B6A2BC
MSLRALPLQFLNLGGEMMYIIDQRLRAQNIPSDKAAKVRNDIIGIMLNRRFVEELFKPQDLYCRSALRTVFDKLAHGSVMRLNAPSMDKLFDLMLMGLKYQVLMCPQPLDLLLVTLNHLDALKSYASSTSVLAQVEDTLNLLIKVYCSMSVGELADIRRSLLDFVQDIHIRVSVFLKEGKQTPSGIFVINHGGSPAPQGGEVPGCIRVFDDKGEVYNILRFTSGDCYSPPTNPYGSLDVSGPRRMDLGTNIYQTQDLSGDRELQNTGNEEISYSSPEMFTQAPLYIAQPYTPSFDSTYGRKARDELNLLAQLIGTASTTNKEFKLNLFQTDDDNFRNDNDVIQEGDFITIEGGMRDNRPELGQIMGELTLNEADNSSDKGQDLLDLMDSI